MKIKRVFCMDEVQWGDALSLSRVNDHDLHEVVKYNGKKFFGISNNTVVDIDLARYPLGNQVPIGGLIDCVQKGEFRVRKILFKNPEQIDYFKYVKPTKNGWMVQSKQTKKSVARIECITENAVDLELL